MAHNVTGPSAPPAKRLHLLNNVHTHITLPHCLLPHTSSLSTRRSQRLSRPPVARLPPSPFPLTSSSRSSPPVLPINLSYLIAHMFRASPRSPPSSFYAFFYLAHPSAALSLSLCLCLVRSLAPLFNPSPLHPSLQSRGGVWNNIRLIAV